MNITEDIIREHSIKRIAKLFNKSIEEIDLNYQFGVDLNASFKSFFKENELDKILCDIQDAADRAIYKELEKGKLVIEAVEDYCSHMVRCYEVNPKDVKYVLGLN